MNARYALLLAGLVVLLLGCTQQLSAPSEITKYVCADGSVVSNSSSCPAVQSGGSVAKSQPITLETELAVCSGMPEFQSASLEDVCIMGLAGKHENSSLCKKVGSNQRTNCYALVAEISNDADVCSNAGTQKDQCYDQYARNTKDVSACDKISDINNRDSCYNGLAGTLADPAICNKIRSVSQKDSCYWNIASRLGDSSYCNKITNSNQMQNCLNNFVSGQPSGQPQPPIQQGYK